MKTVFLTIAILIIGLSGQAQKAYGAESYTIAVAKNGVLGEPKEVHTPISLLLLSDEFYLQLFTKLSIESPIQSKEILSPLHHVYKSPLPDDGSSLIEVHVRKSTNLVKVEINTGNMIIRFETTDENIL